MRIIYALLCLFASLSITAQFKRGDQAVLKQCAETTAPFICTNQKLEVDISLLVTPEIMTDIRKASNKDYFTISVIFVTNADGKAIPAETRILCENKILENKIGDYIHNIAAFEPKNETHADRRSAHAVDITYVYNQENKQYFIAGKEELKRLKIKPETVPLDSYPIFPGCEGYEKDRDLKCLGSAMTRFILKIFRIPETENEGTTRMMVQLIVEKDGRISLQEIEGDNGPLSDEVKRVVKELPVIVPGKISNIPVRVACTLPITVNISN